MDSCDVEDDEMRPNYERSDLGELVRGKYAPLVHDTVLIALDPVLARAFPSAEAVSEALRQVLDQRKSAGLDEPSPPLAPPAP